VPVDLNVPRNTADGIWGRERPPGTWCAEGENQVHICSVSAKKSRWPLCWMAILHGRLSGGADALISLILTLDGLWLAFLTACLADCDHETRAAGGDGYQA